MISLKRGRIRKPPTTDKRPLTHLQVHHRSTDYRQPTTDLRTGSPPTHRPPKTDHRPTDHIRTQPPTTDPPTILEPNHRPPTPNPPAGSPLTTEPLCIPFCGNITLGENIFCK